MPRRDDTRSFTTKALYVVTKVLVITALGMGLSPFLGDVGISVRALGVLSALAVGGTAVVVSDYAAAAERRRCEEERRAIEEEDRKVDAIVAEMEAEQRLNDLGYDLTLDQKSRFVEFVEEHRRRSMCGTRSL